MRLLSADGVNYRVIGPTISGQVGSEPGDSRHQPTGHRLDPVPAVLASAEWSSLERGIIQRAELLDLIAIDLYGPRDLIARGLLPPRWSLVIPGSFGPATAKGCPAVASFSTYVVTAWGRDYDDVAPLKGVIQTEGSTTKLDVTVDVVRRPD